MKNIKLIIFTGVFISLFLLVPSVNAQECQDFDQDGLTDCEETNIYHTNPNLADTDEDGYLDGHEVENNYSPRHATKTKLYEVDSDEDGLIDSWEIALGTNLLNEDTDGDGYLDGEEVEHSYSPTNSQPIKVEKLIEVNLDIQSLTYYFDRIPIDSFKISSGVASMPTPEGDFIVLNKVPSKTYGGTGFDFYYPNTLWNLHFTTDYWRYYIHGAYWHNNFGHVMSHGCVNVAYENMERLYTFAEDGSRIHIF